MQLFYNANIDSDSEEVVFDKNESRHIINVLRKKENDVLHLTNGNGFIFDAKLISSDPKRCIAMIIGSVKHDPLTYRLHLAVAPTKMNGRYEWFLEKATEIGVDEITPIICDRSERKTIKSDRYEKIMQSAMKQSLKTYLPILNKAVSLKDFITNRPENEIKLIAHCAKTDKQPIKTVLKDLQLKNRSLNILIGPEGDFSEKEINEATQNGFLSISLGKSRLRTETAAIIACHSVYFTVYP